MRRLGRMAGTDLDAGYADAWVDGWGMHAARQERRHFRDQGQRRGLAGGLLYRLDQNWTLGLVTLPPHLGASWLGWRHDGFSGGIHGRLATVFGDATAVVGAVDPQTLSLPLLFLGPKQSKVIAEFGGSLDFAMGRAAALSLAYDGRAGGGFVAHQGRTTLKIRF